MFKKTLPLLIITLIAGLFYGCGSSNPHVRDAKSGIEDQNYEAALQAAEESIQNYPQDPTGYYYKGVALGEIAGTKEPAERQKYYEEMNEAFEQAREVAQETEKTPGEIERIDAFKNVLWRTEHNKSIEYAANDSVKQVTENPLKLAISHLQNATTVIPDSVLSWDVLSQVYYMDNNVEAAAKTMEIAIQKKDSLTAEDYLRLSGYYRLNEQPEEAVGVLEKAREKFPQNEQIVQNLADAYTSTGETEKSIAVVEELIKQDPENPQYHLVLGTQIYQSVLQMNETIKENYDEIFDLEQKARSASGSEKQKIEQQVGKLEEESQELQSRIDELTEKATEEIQTVIKYRPNDDVAYNTLGIIYQNKAAALFEERNREVTDNQRASELDSQAREVLRQSLSYYEKAAEINPENQNYWKSLFEIYTNLGMDKQAMEAMKKAGL